MDREEAIQTWLETHKVTDAWRLAPLLAEANLKRGTWRVFADAAGDLLNSELTRFATLLEMDRIADELEHSTARISDLVKAIKEYSYMDQAQHAGSGHSQEPGYHADDHAPQAEARNQR